MDAIKRSMTWSILISKTEDAHGSIILGNASGDVDGEGGFTDCWSSGENDQVGFLESAQCLVELGVSRGYATYGAFILALDALQGTLQFGGECIKFMGEGFLRNAEQLLFGFARSASTSSSSRWPSAIVVRWAMSTKSRRVFLRWTMRA